MNFAGPLDAPLAERVSICDRHLLDPERLALLAKTELMDSPTEKAFDRLAMMAAHILKVPLTIISLVGDKKQFFKAGFGLPAPYDKIRQVPIDESICRYTLAGHEIIASDTSKDPLLKLHPTTKPWGIGAFIAIPMRLPLGHVLGAFCAVDPKPRPWSDEDIYILRELTASVMTEIQLRLQLKDLEIERDLREQFMATLTHDLRTPLSVTKMAIEVVADPNVAQKERDEFTQMISDSMDRADHMIRDLLDVLTIKANERISLDIQEWHLNDLVKRSLAALTQLHGERFILEASQEIYGYWDRIALQRMIENLCTNAVKYGDKKKPVAVSLKLFGEKLEVAVHNHGTPIPAEHLTTLFEPYRRLDNARSSRQKGWGIGLTLVRGFAEAHSGKATADSSVEKGTTFTLHLPRDARA